MDTLANLAVKFDQYLYLYLDVKCIGFYPPEGISASLKNSAGDSEVVYIPCEQLPWVQVPCWDDKHAVRQTFELLIHLLTIEPCNLERPSAGPCTPKLQIQFGQMHMLQML